MHKPSHLELVVCLLGLSALAGCAGQTIIVDGIEVYEKHWNKTIQELRPRVAFDISCPAEQAQFTLFKRTQRYPTEVGVTGCGTKATYVRAVGAGGVGPWVLMPEARRP